MNELDDEIVTRILEWRELMEFVEIQDVKELKRRFGDFLNIEDLRE